MRITTAAGMPFFFMVASPIAASVGLDAGRVHDASPLFHFGLDDGGELLGRAALDLDAGALQLRTHVFHPERRIDRAVQLRDDLLWRPRRREDSTPGRRVVTGERFGDRRNL